MKKMLIVLVFFSLLIVTSSTLWSLQLTHFKPTIAGKATVAEGSISLYINPALSISANDSSIDFGTCVPNTTRGYTLVDSELNNSQANNYECDGTFPDSFSIVNDGTFPANVSLQANSTGALLFNDSDSWVAYKIVPDGADCTGSYAVSYTNFTVPDQEALGCDNLSSGGHFNVPIKLFINETVRQGGSFYLTFEAAIPS